MARRIDWQDILELAENNVPTSITLDGEQAVFVLALSVFYKQRFFWTFGDRGLTDEEWDAVSLMVGDMENKIIDSMD